MEAKWYACMTAANRESDAYINLRRQGYGVLYLRRWHTWSRNGQTTSELRPFLSRYLFASVEPHQSVMAINETDGVSRVLTMHGDAYEVPRETIWEIRKCFDPDGIEPPGIRTERHIRKMLRGIKGEAAAELMSALERLDDTGRYRLQRNRAVRLAADSLPTLRRKAAENSHFELARGAAA